MNASDHAVIQQTSFSQQQLIVVLQQLFDSLSFKIFLFCLFGLFEG